VAAGTPGAGALLCLLRERSGSLATPALLHLAANGAGALASALASRMQEHAGLAGAGYVEVVAGPGAGDE
jgi:membrane protease YdiL (CAAX protease family)